MKQERVFEPRRPHPKRLLPCRVCKRPLADHTRVELKHCKDRRFSP